jgi:hypothetical protein
MMDDDCDGLVDCADPDCTGTQPCPRASKDPTIILFGVGGRLDRIRGHVKLTMGPIDLTTESVHVLLNDRSGVIFTDGVPAGGLHVSPLSSIYQFRNTEARTKGGMYDLKIKKNKDNRTYTLGFTAYGDLSRATDPHMRLQFYIGDDPGAAHDGRVFITVDTPWHSTGHGWRAPKDH